jgi:hypothetical protein
MEKEAMNVEDRITQIFLCVVRQYNMYIDAERKKLMLIKKASEVEWADKSNVLWIALLFSFATVSILVGNLDRI